MEVLFPAPWNVNYLKMKQNETVKRAPIFCMKRAEIPENPRISALPTNVLKALNNVR